jgi:hypothetical protein
MPRRAGMFRAHRGVMGKRIMIGREKGHGVTPATRQKISATLKGLNAAKRAQKVVTGIFPAREPRKIRGRHTHESRAKISAGTRLAMADPVVRAKVIAANSSRGQRFSTKRRLYKVRCVQCAFLAELRYMEIELMTDGSKQWQCISVKACERRLSAMLKVAA